MPAAVVNGGRGYDGRGYERRGCDEGGCDRHWTLLRGLCLRTTDVTVIDVPRVMDSAVYVICG